MSSEKISPSDALDKITNWAYMSSHGVGRDMTLSACGIVRDYIAQLEKRITAMEAVCDDAGWEYAKRIEDE